MHPILYSRRRLSLYLLAWLHIGVLLAIGLRREGTWIGGAAVFLPATMIYAFVCLSAWYVCRVFPIDDRSRGWKVIVVHGAAAAFASALWVAFTGAWARMISSVFASLGTDALFLDRRPILFMVGALLFWLAAAFHYLLIAFQASREAETRALELNLLAREAELKALRAQIDPHFIFNSLHSISALTATDPAAARRMCLLLADFLRETLRLGASQRIPLADEFALADRFLAIEQVRLGSRLQIEREADPAAVECLVPPLVLQPLVENAIVHGVAQLVDGGTIRMAANRAGPMLMITLENPCDPERAQTRGVGLGLQLLRNRLTTQFGPYDAVHAAEDAGRFRVEVRIPAVTAA